MTRCGTMQTLWVPDIVSTATGCHAVSMRVCIHRGTQEIGGSCIEIEANGKRIVLDLGLPLTAGPNDNPEDFFPLVKGLREPADDLLALLISHPHQDHYGLASFARPELPVLIGDAARRILKVARQFTPSGLAPDVFTPLRDRELLSVGPFRITPYLVDHSAYDAYAILVDCNDKRLLYSGDFRGHGRKAKVFERFLKDPPGDVDVLLMEGTTISRNGKARRFASEDDLEAEFAEYFRATRGLALVWSSGQNIDRLVTIFRACKRAGKQFIIDLYTAEILRATGNPKVPQGTWDGIRVFLPRSQRNRVKERGLFDEVNHYRSNRISSQDLAKAASHSVMLFRPGLMRELDAADCLKDSRLAYSLWQGYLRDPRQARFMAWLKERSIPIEMIHTSGHASPDDLSRFAEAVGARRLVPIHTFAPEAFGDLFPRVEQKEDGVWWEV